MDKIRIIEIKKNIFSKNFEDANNLRKYLDQKGVFLINVMSSPGSGKTTTLIALINALKKDFKIKVMEADIDSDVDAKKIMECTGVESIQLHTGGMCHLDAKMTEYGLNNLNLDQVDLLFLENVGNLVCPAEFDTGSHLNMNILSVPEGDDKPLKYPLMFEVCNLVVVNKIDVEPYFNFDYEKCVRNIKIRNANAHVIKISALKGDGIEELANWIKKEILKRRR